MNHDLSQRLARQRWADDLAAARARRLGRPQPPPVSATVRRHPAGRIRIAVGARLVLIGWRLIDGVH